MPNSVVPVPAKWASRSIRPKVQHFAASIDTEFCTNGIRLTACSFFFFQAEDGIRDVAVTGVQTCASSDLGRLHRGAEKGTCPGALERARRAIVPGGVEPRIPAAALPRRARRGRGLRGRVPNLRRALRADGEPHYREDPLYEVLIALREVPVEDQMAQAVHQRPGRRSGAADIASIRGQRGLELID